MIKNKLWSIKYKFKKKINKKINVVKMTFKLYTMQSKTKRDIKKCYNLAFKRKWSCIKKYFDYMLRL